MEEKKDEILGKINDLLNANDEREKIRELIAQQLVDTGWYDQMKATCRKHIRNKGVDNVNVDEVVSDLEDIAKNTIPEEVTNSVTDYLKTLIRDNLQTE
nr:enhancer of yellow 2 transcription factor [Hymenolepis microstoma]